MMEDIRASLSEDAKRLVDDHLRIGPEKSVSYLPIKTVEKVIGITVQDYTLLIERSGNEAIVVGAEECCISSGAVYAFDCHCLSKILKDNQIILSEHGWPATPVDFIRRIAAEWVDEESPIMPVIRKAFGDTAPIPKRE